MQRYHLQNDEKFVEFPYDEEGLKCIKLYRKLHPEFKGRKIKSVLQLYPSIVYIGREYYSYSNKTYITDHSVAILEIK
jgi:hypothetical protein